METEAWQPMEQHDLQSTERCDAMRRQQHAQSGFRGGGRGDGTGASAVATGNEWNDAAVQHRDKPITDCRLRRL